MMRDGRCTHGKGKEVRGNRLDENQRYVGASDNGKKKERPADSHAITESMIPGGIQCRRKQKAKGKRCVNLRKERWRDKIPTPGKWWGGEMNHFRRGKRNSGKLWQTVSEPNRKRRQRRVKSGEGKKKSSTKTSWII